MSEYTALSISQSQPVAIELKYGFGLGRLFYRLTTNKPAPRGSLEDAGFYVICSTSDKSLWAVFDFLPKTETGDYVEVKPENGEKYGLLPGSPGSAMIGVQKLFGGQWSEKRGPSFEGADPFRNNLGGGSPVQARVTAKPVVEADVFRSVKKRTGSSPSN